MEFLITILNLYKAILIVRVFMSWIRPDPSHPLVNFIYSITDPLLDKIRDLLPQNGMGIDFSPLVVLFGIDLLQRVVFGGYF